MFNCIICGTYATWRGDNVCPDCEDHEKNAIVQLRNRQALLRVQMRLPFACFLVEDDEAVCLRRFYRAVETAVKENR